MRFGLRLNPEQLTEIKYCWCKVSQVNPRYVATRECNRTNEANETTHATLESRYLPLKLFVCRCSTDSGGSKMKECDVELRKKIPEKEKATHTEVTDASFSTQIEAVPIMRTTGRCIVTLHFLFINGESIQLNHGLFPRAILKAW